MPQAVDEAGNVWEVDATGEPVRIIAPAASSGGRVFSLPPNPKDVRSEARADEDQQLQRESAIRAERAAERADRTAQRQAAAAERAAEAQAKPTEYQAKSAGFLGRMMQAERDFTAVPEDDRGGRSLPRQVFHNVAPGLENTLINSPERQKADQAVENFIAASLRQESGAAISSGEFERQYKIFFPAPGDTPEVLAQKAAARRQAIDGFRIAAGPLADQVAGKAAQQADNEVPDPTTGADLKPPVEENSPPDAPPPENDADVTAATGKSRITRDARMSAQIDAMINAGASKGMIDAVLKRQNFDIVTPGEWKEIQDWRTGPGKGKKYFGANISRTEDLSALQRAAGSPAAAFAAHMADAGTAGLVGAAAGEQGRGALDAMAAANPTAATLGGVTGGVTGALGAEAAIAARAPAALAKYAPRVADTLYGGLYGFNTAREGEGLQGAALGAGAGLAGGMIGERAMRGVGRLARGVQDPNVQALRERDIPLTVGQTVGGGGPIGQGVKKIEDALTSVPFVGNMVDARRMEGLEAFNRSAFNEGALGQGTVGRIGPEGVDDLRTIKDNAYSNALDPVQIDPTTPQLGEDLNAARAYAQAHIPDEIDQARTAALAALDSRVTAAVDPATGMIPGRNFQEAYRGLARTGRERGARDYGQEIGQTMRQGQDALAGAVEEQFPGSFPAFLEANAINRNLNTISDAVKNSNSNAGIFTPSQLGRADVGSTSRLQGKIEAAGTNRPFYDLTSAGQAVLPSKLPDSGTWTRALIGGGAPLALGGGLGYAAGGGEGAATGTGLSLGATLLLAAGGSKPAQKAMTKLLADRPDLAVTIGNQLVDNSGIGGWTGAGTLAPLLVGQ